MIVKNFLVYSLNFLTALAVPNFSSCYIPVPVACLVHYYPMLRLVLEEVCF